MDLIDINFDIIRDTDTGAQLVQIKSLPNNIDFQGKKLFRI